MKELTIGEVAKYAGIESSAIRYYESVGLLPPPKRKNGRNRRYDLDILKRLGLIQLLRQAGLGIKEMQTLLSGADAPDAVQWQTLAAQKIAEMDALIKQTQTTRAWLAEALDQECSGIDECIRMKVDDGDGGINVTLWCEHAPLSIGQNSTKLMTMQPGS